MTKTGVNWIERRTATRYRMPGNARVYWAGGDGAQVAVSDMSAGGCQVVGEALPGVGSRVFLSLELAGLPNVRLAATVVRRAEASGQLRCGLRFEVPSERLSGLTRLLDCEARNHETTVVVVVDSDPRSREKVAQAVEHAGAHVIAVGSAFEAVSHARGINIDVLLARADPEGLSALAAMAEESQTTFRVAFGRGHGLTTAVTQGFAEATADDPCSAKCLSDLMQRRSRPPGAL
jgi:CheY-like chemotaxis protein